MIKYFKSMFDNIKTKVTKLSCKTYIEGIDGTIVLHSATVHCTDEYDNGTIEIRIPGREPIVGGEYMIDLFTKGSDGSMITLYRGKVKMTESDLYAARGSKALYKIFTWEADRRPKGKKNIRLISRLSRSL